MSEDTKPTVTVPRLTTREDILNEWADRLVSGRYPQGRMRLRKQTEDGDEFCCLGVLCEIAVEQGVIPPPTTRRERQHIRDATSDQPLVYVYGNADVHDLSITGLPVEVSQWANVDDLGSLTGNEWKNLAAANDSGYTFDAIAALIREGRVLG